MTVDIDAAHLAYNHTVLLPALPLQMHRVFVLQLYYTPMTATAGVSANAVAICYTTLKQTFLSNGAQRKPVELLDGVQNRVK